MPDRPIIFSAPMVRALLDGRKTQTRRVLKPQPPRDEETGRAFNGTFFGPEWFTSTAIDRHGDEVPGPEVFGIYGDDWGMRIPYAPGDRLWVREAFWTCEDCGYLNHAVGANNSGTAGRHCCASCDALLPKAKRSPIHMPRWASRLTLTVTDVRVQRVQEISAADAIAEGIAPAANSMTIDCDTLNPRDNFASLWNSIHGPGAWDANPWVAAITFTVRKGNIDHD